MPHVGDYAHVSRSRYDNPVESISVHLSFSCADTSSHLFPKIPAPSDSTRNSVDYRLSLLGSLFDEAFWKTRAHFSRPIGAIYFHTVKHYLLHVAVVVMGVIGYTVSEAESWVSLNLHLNSCLDLSSTYLAHTSLL